jgi:hypothetical protein
MHTPLAPRNHALVALAAALALSACGKNPGNGTLYAFTSPTPVTHRAFPIETGHHALDCVACHADFATFKQFTCVDCHTKAVTDPVHTTTPAYLVQAAAGFATYSAACYGCHTNPLATPFDHMGITPTVTNCAPCHAQGNFYAALPVAGYTHSPITQDCTRCHTPGTWLNVSAPSGLIADPMTTVTVNTLVARFSGTTIVQLTPLAQVLPMGMNHATTHVNMAGLACSVCHLDIGQGSLYPGLLHSSLANLTVAQPTQCLDCHSISAPNGFVGPTATSPARTPPSGEMKHDAVTWNAGAPTTTRVVTADCGTCHLAPNQDLAATWSTWTSGTQGTNALPQFHTSLTGASLAQPTSCVDCHANSRPVAVLSSAAASLPAGLTFDHANAVATGDCAGCHGSTATWAGGRYHAAGSASPTTCLPCHAGERPSATVNPVSGWNSLTYTSAPFDYTTNAAGITHGDGQDCAVCHKGPGTHGATPGAWGVSQTFEGGRFAHGPGTVATSTCIACHMSQRPDLFVAAATYQAWLTNDPTSLDHSANPGDCIGCHQATVARGSYVSYYGAGGAFPGGDWRGGKVYPGNMLVSAPNRFVTVTETSLIRATPGGLVTGTSTIQDTRYNAMLHTSAQVPPQVSPGTSATGDMTTCWHCHLHAAGSTTITSFANGVFHTALTNYMAGVNGPVVGLQQPNSGCADCHAQMRPGGIVELAGSVLQPMDHAALFTGTAGSVADLDCSTCHKQVGLTWGDGTFHANIGSAVPADCVACHYPLMASGSLANVTSGVLYAMSHASTQLTFQTCTTCHTTALTSAPGAPYLATDWKPGAYHASVPAQPAACIDCHAVSEPLPNHSTQSSWTYTLALGGTTTNSAQWMNHGAAPVAGADCVKCHAADAKAAVTTWSKSTQFHLAVTAPGTCQACHGLLNGGGAVVGTNNNLPVGVTNSSMLSTAPAGTNTGVPAGTFAQISHADVNVTGNDCSFCHTQAGISSSPAIQGHEWAQASFHTSFTASTPLLLNGGTGRCSNCHLNVKPGTSYTAQDHSGFTATSTQDCSACHSWPGTGTSAAPNWKGATGTPLYITVGGFTIPAPPAATPTTQTGIASLPHPTVTAPTTCATCHSGGVPGKMAIGYDHKSGLANSACNACHEAGTNLLGTPWNGATAQASGAGDSRPFTLTAVTAQRGSNGGTCNITAAKHFYPVDCGQCHAAPAGTGPVTTGSAYTTAWLFPHTQSKMTNPGTCNLCHVGQGCSK